ncbi:MAG TPA: SDR family NAD(P)-dependent oxidoreductase [Candidatus Binataceae bacterium]|nr:SDR family NAD(P)-dependent oxidoreductase [Candidatus Binataceae bacterium]
MSQEKHGKRLLGKVAIVTGAGRGIGRSEALLLAAEGAKVIVNDVFVENRGSADELQIAARVVGEIRAAGGEAVASGDSVASMQGAERIINTALREFGRLDIVINNAGNVRPGNIHEMNEYDWDRVVQTHLKGAFAMTRFAAPVFCRQGSGVIINTGSESGLGHATMANYSAAKEGVIGLTRSVARELGRFGVRCNGIRPRALTQSVQNLGQTAFRQSQSLERALGKYSLGNRGDVPSDGGPEHVAPLVVWLCTDAARNVNGRTFYVCGDEIGLFSEPELERSLIRTGGWDLDSLDHYARERLINDLTNEFLLEGYPELKKFS